jgi:hypothetical protein
MQYLAHFGRKRSLKMWPRGVGLDCLRGIATVWRECCPPAAIIATTDASSAETGNFRLGSSADIVTALPNVRFACKRRHPIGLA